MNSAARSSRLRNSCPWRIVEATGRRPSRVIRVNADAGAVPCACGPQTSTSTTARTLRAAVRKGTQLYLGGRGRGQVAGSRWCSATCPPRPAHWKLEHLANARYRKDQEQQEQHQEQAGQ